MLAVKNKLNSMKLETALSEDRIRKFETTLKISRDHLESALLEKESLHRRIEAVESQIIDANKQREDMQDKIQSFEAQITDFHCKRRDLCEGEKNVNDDITKLEKQLKHANEHLAENTVRHEEAERRLETLDTDCAVAIELRKECEKRSAILEREIDQKLLRLKACEDFERKYGEAVGRRADERKMVESYYRDGEGRVEKGKIDINRLQRVVERTEDEIESLQLRSRAAQIELQHAIQTVVHA